MSRETAITEEIPYSTQKCYICGEEVANETIPDGEMAHRGYAVILGEGQVECQPGEKGNWDKEVQFVRRKKDSGIPNVTGYIICEPCSGMIHDHKKTNSYFTGDIPTKIDSLSPFQKSGLMNIMKIVVSAIIILVLFILLVL